MLLLMGWMPDGLSGLWSGPRLEGTTTPLTAARLAPYTAAGEFDSCELYPFDDDEPSTVVLLLVGCHS